MPNDPRKHHFVPECYLKQFIAKNHLHVLNIQSVRKWRKINISHKQPSSICYIENYYLINPSPAKAPFNLDSYHKLYIEIDIFQILENVYGKIAQKLTNSSSIASDEAIKIADFILQLKMRNPMWRNGMDEGMVDRILNKIITDPKTKAIFNYSPEEFREKALQAKQSILADQTLHERAYKNSIIERFQADSKRNAALLSAIMKHRWTILKAPNSGPHFVTTDNPGVGVDNGKCLNSNFLVGCFYFPLTYSHCLQIENVVVDKRYARENSIKRVRFREVLSSEVSAINDLMKEVANQLIIASDDVYISRLAMDIINGRNH